MDLISDFGIQPAVWCGEK